MGSRKGISLARYKLIYKRQENPSWDADYVPGQLATPQEAPSISRAYILTPEKLGARDTHLLSTPERNAALLGLYHPEVVGLQEQRILPPEPRVHPLWTFPGIDRSNLPGLCGTIEAAEYLGFLDVLPKLWVMAPDSDERKIPVVFPWLGDLLWAIRSTEDRMYCVNWSIKGKAEEFCQKSTRGLKRNPSFVTVQELLARHEIEDFYYKSGKIPTYRISGDGIDWHVANNLRQLFLHHRRSIGLAESQRQALLASLQQGLELGTSAADVIRIVAARRGVAFDDCRSAFYQMVWNRELRLDLFSPVLIDRPMKAEVRDVVQEYADWFKVAE